VASTVAEEVVAYATLMLRVVVVRMTSEDLVGTVIVIIVVFSSRVTDGLRDNLTIHGRAHGRVSSKGGAVFFRSPRLASWGS